jgi:type II secretory pathway pseudopilin PulG
MDRPASKGETLVEVLLAITVAAFSITTATAIATRSNQKAMSARERNQATTFLESQISALKLRLYSDPSNFDNTFGVPSSFSLTGTARRFCLDAQSKSPSDTADPWQAYVNHIDDTNADTLATGSPGYDAKCKITSNNADFYIDIAAIVTTASRSSSNPAVFRFDVRWSEFGSGDTQKAEVFYRLPPQIASAPPSGPVGPVPGGDIQMNIIVMTHPLLALKPQLKLWADGVLVKNYTWTPAQLKTSCPDAGFSSAPFSKQWSTTTPSYSSYYDRDEICQSFGSLSLTVSPKPTTVAVEMVNDANGYATSNPGCANSLATNDQRCYEDNNILISDLTVDGVPASFQSYPANTAFPNLLPAAGSHLNPFVLWLNWDGVATFSVN